MAAVQRHFTARRITRLVLVAFGLALGASFAMGIIGAGSPSANAAPVSIDCQLYTEAPVGTFTPILTDMGPGGSIETVPPFELPDTFDPDNDMDCTSSVPAPQSTQSPGQAPTDCFSFASYEFDNGVTSGLVTPYDLGIPPYSDETPACFNVVSQMLPLCASNTQWIVAKVTNPPFDSTGTPIPVGGSMTITDDSNGGLVANVPFNSSVANETLTLEGTNFQFATPVATLWGAYTPIPDANRPATVTVELFGVPVATFPINPADSALLDGPCGADTNPCDTGGSADCEPKLFWDCAGDIFVSVQGGGGSTQGTITTTFTPLPLDPGSPPVSFTDALAYSPGSPGSWSAGVSYGPTVTNALQPGHYSVEVTLTFTDLVDADGKNLTYTHSPATELRTDCFGSLDVTCPSVEASHIVDGSPVWPAIGAVELYIYDDTGTYVDYADLSSGTGTVTVSDPGLYGFVILDDDGGDNVTEWLSGTFLCVAAEADCQSGQVVVTADARSGNAVVFDYDDYLDDIDAAVTTATSTVGPDAPGTSWPLEFSLSATPAVPITFDVTTTAVSALAGAGAFPLTLPDVAPDDDAGVPLCAVSAEVACVAGSPTLVTNPTANDDPSNRPAGTPTGTLVVGPTPTVPDYTFDTLATDLSALVGQSVTFWVGDPDDEFDATGVRFVDGNTAAPNSITFIVPDCILDVVVECASGQSTLAAFSDETNSVPPNVPVPTGASIAVTEAGAASSSLTPNATPTTIGNGATRVLSLAPSPVGMLLRQVDAGGSELQVAQAPLAVSPFDCTIDAAIVCVAGVPTLQTNPSVAASPANLPAGTPDGIAIVGPSPTQPDYLFSGLTTSFNGSEGSSVTFWVGDPNDGYLPSGVQFAGGNAGAPHSVTLTVPDCVIDLAVVCAAGQTTVAATTDAGAAAPAGSSVTVAEVGGPLAGTVVIDGAAFGLGNDDDLVRSFDVAVTGSGVMLQLTDPTGALDPIVAESIEIDGRDCTVDITSACVAGVPTITVTRGNAAVGSVTLVDTGQNLPFGATPPSTPTFAPGVVHVVVEPAGDTTAVAFTSLAIDPVTSRPTATFQLPAPFTFASDNGPAAASASITTFDCIAEIIVDCISWPTGLSTPALGPIAYHGVPTVRALVDGTPPGTAVTVANAPAAFAADPAIVDVSASGLANTWILSNDEHDEPAADPDPRWTFEYLIDIDNGVIGVVFPGSPGAEQPTIISSGGSTAWIGGLDCTVEVDVACVSGQATLIVDRGNTGLDGFGWSTTETGPYAPVDGWVDDVISLPVGGTEVWVDLNAGPTVSATVAVNLPAIFRGLTIDADPVGSNPLTEHRIGPRAARPVPVCSYAVTIACSATTPGNVIVDVSQAAVTSAAAPTVAPVLIDHGDGTFTVPPAAAVVVTPADDDTIAVGPDGSVGTATSPLVLDGLDCDLEAAWTIACVSGAAIAVPLDITPPTVGFAGAAFAIGPVSWNLTADPFYQPGDTVAGADIFTVTTSGGGPLPGNLIARFTPESLTMPACTITAAATVDCVAGEITVRVETSGALPTAIIIDGVSFAPDANGDLVTTVPRQAAHTIDIVAPNGGTIVEPASTISLDAPCRVEVDVTATCISADQVAIVVALGAGSTGTIDPSGTTVLATVDATTTSDTMLPFLVPPGASVAVTVTSPDTIDDAITVPAVAVPGSCAGGGVSGTVFVDWTAACADDNPDDVEVIVTVRGLLAGLSVNGSGPTPLADGSLLYRFDPGATIAITALVLNPLDVAQLSGPARAPVCLTATPTPQPTPTPIAIPVPPSIPVNPIAPPAPEPTVSPTPDAAPQPTATPEPEPTATAAPAPSPTPEPEPTATPEPTPTPDPEPTDEPDPLTPPATRQAVRQHGQSRLSLPADCGQTIDIPGAVRLEAVETDGQTTVYLAETATLDVGIYTQTISCGTTDLEVELFVYRQIGGARGEANTVGAVSSMLGALTLVVFGLPRIINRRELV